MSRYTQYTRPNSRPRRPLRGRRDSLLQPRDEFTGARSEFPYLAPHESELTGNVLMRDTRPQKGSWDEPGYHGFIPQPVYFEPDPDPEYH